MFSDDFLKHLQGLQPPKFEQPTYDLPDLPDLRLPDKSASGLLESLDMVIDRWREELPEDAQPVILAIPANGIVIEARRFYEAGHHGIGIRGRLLADDSDCLVFTHQATMQLLCRVVKAEPEKKYRIGFRYGDRSDE